MIPVAQRPSDETNEVPTLDPAKRSTTSQIAVDEQRRAALKAANAKRSLHRQLKEELAGLQIMDSRNLAGHVLVYDRERFESIELRHLLRAIRSWGPGKTRRLCQKLEINERVRLSGLSDTQAKQIAAILARQSSLQADRDE